MLASCGLRVFAEAPDPTGRSVGAIDDCGRAVRGVHQQARPEKAAQAQAQAQAPLDAHGCPPAAGTNVMQVTPEHVMPCRFPQEISTK